MSKPKKGYKPPKNHPWRTSAPSKAISWARQEASNKPVNDWKVGGGKPSWNGGD